MERPAKHPSPAESTGRPAAEHVGAEVRATVPARPLAGTIQNSPAMLAQRRQIRSVFGNAAQLAASGSREPAEQRDLATTGAAPVQRRIHAWSGDGWDPGEKGMEGRYALPEKPLSDQRFFNDVTGKAGKTAKQASEQLDKLAVERGSVKTLMADGGEALKALDQLMRGSFDQEADNQTNFLGYYRFSKDDETWNWSAGGDAVDGGDWTADVGSFLKNFMAANGQLDYIRSRDWYIQGTHTVEVDVNYYVNRAFNTAPPYWHKDTGGGNLFVNLIFTNTTPIIATETTADDRPMGNLKKASLQANMPKSQVDEIEAARRELATRKEATKISGGKLPEWGYLSWVDELMWHSSPFMANRKKWSLASAANVMSNMVSPQPFFQQETETTYEAMVIIASTPRTHLSRLIKGRVLDMDERMARIIFTEGYNLGGVDALELRRDLVAVNWAAHKLNSAFGHEQDASDPRVEKPKGFLRPVNLITASGLMGRPRSLSNAEKRQDLQPLAGGGKGRNFLRTWVRVIPNKQ